MRMLFSVLVVGLCFYVAPALADVANPDSLIRATMPDTVMSDLPVFIYGEECPPPAHVFTYANGKLFLDGIQIEPRIKELPTITVTADIEARYELNNAADAAAANAVGKTARALARKEVYERSPLVAWAEIDAATGYLKVMYHGERDATYVGDIERPGTPVKRRPGDAAYRLYLEIKDALDYSRLVLIGGSYEAYISDLDRAYDQIARARQSGKRDERGPVIQDALADILAKQ